MKDSLAQQVQAFAGMPDGPTRLITGLVIGIVLAILILLLYARMKRADRETERE